jgi:hypothetical protein
MGLERTHWRRQRRWLGAPASPGYLFVGALDETISRVTGLESGKADCDGSAGADPGQHLAHGFKTPPRVFDRNARENAHELIAADASDHVV